MNPKRLDDLLTIHGATMTLRQAERAGLVKLHPAGDDAYTWTALSGSPDASAPKQRTTHRLPDGTVIETN